MQNYFRIEFDLEIERTFSLKEKEVKARGVKSQSSSASSTIAEGGDNERRMLRDVVTPRVQGIASNIAWPNVEAHNFELKLSLIFVV